MQQAGTIQGNPIYDFWENITAKRSGRHISKSRPERWGEQVYHLSLHGVAIEEALKYIYNEGPDFDLFMQWIQATAAPLPPTPQTDDVLTAEDLAHWDENGYVILRNAVSGQQCAAARQAIWTYLGADINNPDSWYSSHPGKNGLMLTLFQDAALRANRASGRIYKAYCQLYNSSDIYLYIDKVSFNPPETSFYKFKGSPLHWDVSLHQPIPFSTQGLLYLGDTGPDDGAFHCVPGFHKRVSEWLKGLPPGTQPRDVAVKELKPIPVAANAGDMVIWHQALPHCATPNKAALPRMVQYINYLPVHSKASELWI